LNVTRNKAKKRKAHEQLTDDYSVKKMKKFNQDSGDDQRADIITEHAPSAATGASHHPADNRKVPQNESVNKEKTGAYFVKKKKKLKRERNHINTELVANCATVSACSENPAEKRKVTLIETVNENDAGDYLVKKKKNKAKRDVQTADINTELVANCATTLACSSENPAKKRKVAQIETVSEHDTGDYLVKKKKKKLKGHSGSVQTADINTEHVAVSAEKREVSQILTVNEENTDDYLVKKKKKKVKRDVQTANLNIERGPSSVTSSSQHRALEYLRTWKFAHDSWTFQKVRQVWLLQHMFDSNKVTTFFTF